MIHHQSLWYFLTSCSLGSQVFKDYVITRTPTSTHVTASVTNLRCFIVFFWSFLGDICPMFLVFVAALWHFWQFSSFFLDFWQFCVRGKAIFFLFFPVYRSIMLNQQSYTNQSYFTNISKNANLGILPIYIIIHLCFTPLCLFKLKGSWQWSGL